MLDYSQERHRSLKITWGSQYLQWLDCVRRGSHPGCLPRWKLTSIGWPTFTKALRDPPNFSTLSPEEAFFSLGQKALHLSTHCTPRRPGKPMWNEECVRAVSARWHVWNRWCRRSTQHLGAEYYRQDGICTKTILQIQRKA